MLGLITPPRAPQWLVSGYINRLVVGKKVHPLTRPRTASYSQRAQAYSSTHTYFILYIMGITQRPAGIGRFNVVNKLSKRSLLIAINSIAGLSIFFFGYDQ